ncbi:hypothetical protein BT96DRAFT_1008447 [Gymnopus androsaceus JB14]|uniref:Uncharacterized protein n=1 Tax=Gymnopus androsaceus JB14 TaxID=1447944 RepID=A0A6A4GF48_9AGAR|nr:hypothetical protein BT96DRAFT_1008447 [Gymnopus androsaceus JB14]
MVNVPFLTIPSNNPSTAPGVATTSQELASRSYGPSSVPPAAFTVDVTPSFNGSEPLTPSAAFSAVEADTEDTTTSVDIGLSFTNAETFAEPPASALVNFPMAEAQDSRAKVAEVQDLRAEVEDSMDVKSDRGITKEKEVDDDEGGSDLESIPDGNERADANESKGKQSRYVQKLTAKASGCKGEQKKAVKETGNFHRQVTSEHGKWEKIIVKVVEQR